MATADVIENDPFSAAGGSGSFPKVEELEGRLVLVRPSKVERVNGKFGEQDRVTADVHAYDDESKTWELYEDMYLSQRGMVPALTKKLKPGVTKPFVLGRVQMVPVKDSKSVSGKEITDTDELKDALAEWAKKGGRGEKPRFAWVFGEFSDADAAAARAYISAQLDGF